MKTFFNCLSTSFLIIGTVIGAGFVSGREIIQFFGGNVFVSASIAGILFFVITLLLLVTGIKYKTLSGVNGALFYRSKYLVNGSLFVCMLAVASAGVATVDSLANSLFSMPANLPIFSIIMLILACFCAKKGINGLAFVNALLVPVLLVVSLVLMLFKGGFYYATEGVSNPLLYVSFNMFLSVAVIFEAGAKIDGKTAFYSSLISAVITTVYIVLIYGSVSYEGINAINSDLPLFYSLSLLGNSVSICFACVLVIGSFTTLVSAYYPLAKGFTAVLGRRGDVTALIVVFLLSRLGIKNIVAYAYPVAGVLGVIYFICIPVLSVYKRLVKSK